VIGVNTFYKTINNSNMSSCLRQITSEIDYIGDNSNYNVQYRDSYVVESHNQNRTEFEHGYSIAKEKIPFRKEEWICKLAMHKRFSDVGEIVDYQVPLKISKHDSAGKGKIDLLSYNSETNTAYLLEVKVNTSTESPLKAIMEAYTYWQQINGNQPYDFLSRSIIAKKGYNISKTDLKKAIVLFEKEDERYMFSKLNKHAAELRNLMNLLDVECFVAEPSKQDDNIICNLRRY